MFGAKGIKIPAMDIVHLNGQLLAADKAKISVFDRGFLFGDSIYEVIPFYQGKGFRLIEHIQRLEHSLRAIQIRTDIDWQLLLDNLVTANGGGNLSVYLQVSRGASEERSHQYDADLTPTVFACCKPIKDIYADGADSVEGIAAIVTADLRWRRCDIKATGLLPNILVLQQARQAGAAEAILIRDGILTEGASSNLFMVENGVIYTPKSSSEILGGVTRELLLQLADEQGIPCLQVDIEYSRLLTADEVWISSSTRAIVPVLSIDGQKIADGNKGRLWQQMFERFIQLQHRMMHG
ncbi:aminotransferase class IV [Aliamphritea ceti]|uniref:aminotransferase class IV n=1 Tax=Aliamphritea ceti TaxID=1524258 RepID=UPI0021C2AD0E|nr:aminotransferase class IV [Aliamphritea ceti]